MARVGRLTTLSELSEILLCMQLLLTEANLSVLASVLTTSAHHATVIGDCLHAVWCRTVSRVAMSLLAEVLVARRHSTVASR